MWVFLFFSTCYIVGSVNFSILLFKFFLKRRSKRGIQREYRSRQHIQAGRNSMGFPCADVGCFKGYGGCIAIDFNSAHGAYALGWILSDTRKSVPVFSPFYRRERRCELFRIYLHFIPCFSELFLGGMVYCIWAFQDSIHCVFCNGFSPWHWDNIRIGLLSDSCCRCGDDGNYDLICAQP